MKKMIMMLIALVALGSASAQDYKLAKSTGKLLIKLPAVTVEAYDGNEILFKSEKFESFKDERASGLTMLSGNGLRDNSGIGISVTESGNTVEVNEVSANIGRIVIRVPKGMSVSYKWQAVNNEKAVFRNIQQEIDISAHYNQVELENVTGPVSVNSVFGGVTALFAEKINGPITIASMYAKVDVSVPGSTRANLKLSSTYGNVFAASDMKIDLKKRTDDMVQYNGEIIGSLNGGGTEFTLTSEHGKVYLRKRN